MMMDKLCHGEKLLGLKGLFNPAEEGTARARGKARDTPIRNKTPEFDSDGD